MAQTDGEKEIVLGNKQLISLFFVVVALLGVFFAAGYMIGRNSVTPSMTGQATAGETAISSAPRQETEAPRETASSPDTSAKTGQDQATNAAETPALSRPERSATRPSRTAAVPEEPAEKPVRKIPEAAVTKPEPGATYLQVTALRHPDADNLVRSLREQNFPTTLAESSKEGLFRVLVGPYRENQRVADAKARLKALGFANAFVQR